MADRVVRVTQQGWGSRLGGSIKGAVVGILLAIIAVPLLFWNEGRAVKRARTLAEGAGKVVSVPAASVDPGREGALVHVSGQATTAEVLRDPTFGIERNALALERGVEMYQWVENEERKERKKLGGGTETVTTYTYGPDWRREAIDSATFEEPGGHENPSFPFESESWRAGDVRLGAFHLAPDLAAELDRKTAVPVGEAELERVAADVREGLQVADGGFYRGSDPASPQVGDVRVRFQVVEPAATTVVAAQRGQRLERYHAQAGGDIALVDYGEQTAAAMFGAARTANNRLTWLLRFAGLVLLFVGIRSLLAPLAVAADVVPMIGRLVGVGLSLAALLLAAPVALLTIAVGWLAYRPLLGGALIAVAVGCVAWLWRRSRKPAVAPPVPAFVPPPPPAPAG
jgi:hypothetical protein